MAPATRRKQAGNSSRSAAAASTATAAAGAGAGAGNVDAQLTPSAETLQRSRRSQQQWDRHCRMTVLVLVGCLGAIGILTWEAITEPERIPVLNAYTGFAFAAALASACTLIACVGICFAGRQPPMPRASTASVQLDEYERYNLGNTSALSPADLYIDMVRRSVVNILYQDKPRWAYGEDKKPAWTDGFNLHCRVMGEDVPSEAHTMIGLRRLENIEAVIKNVHADGVPGDLVETGVLKGGSVVFMKACLRALGMEHEGRRVICCDTYVTPPPPPPLVAKLIIFPLVRALASIPSKGFKRWLYMRLQDAQKHLDTMFPYMENPGDDTVECGIFLARYIEFVAQHDVSANLETVKSNFAKYGLLDDSVVFLKGFFSDTLPADIEAISVLRLDGDTYESTATALEPLYPLLSPGGYVIVDDYKSFNECSRAINEYREKHNITSPMHAIDHHAVYWRKEA